MSMSTTATVTYILSKYSRAYPSQAPGSQESEAEWQHFTNPTICLVLDMKKSGEGELESYRVRILWSLNAGQDSMDTDQRDVVFEDIELLSFSSTSAQNFAAHGLPLKAVYRDAVVGIRYLHQKITPGGTSPSYRRFQMNFQNSKDATKFIEAIRHVCPCKANPPGQPALARASTMASTQATQASRPPFLDSGKMPPPPMPVSTLIKTSLRSSMTIASGTRPPTLDSRPCTPDRMSISSLITSNPPFIGHNGVHTIDEASTPGPTSFSAMSGSRAATDPPTTSSYTASPVPSIEAPRTGDNTSPTAYSNNHAALQRRDDNNSSITIPVAAPPTIDATKELQLAQPPAMDVDAPMIPVLPTIPGIYNVSGRELEALVGEVVREDGFVKLLESLDTMWRVKALLGK